MFNIIHIAWWHYIIAGFGIGLYLYNDRLRHWIHQVVIWILRKVIWILRHTDKYYEPPAKVFVRPYYSPPVIKPPKVVQKPTPAPQPTFKAKDGAIEISEQELYRMLKNPEIKVSERRDSN